MTATSGRDLIYVAVCGPGDAATSEVLDQAEEVGRLIARAGAVVVCGGLGGVMEAAARGASDEGGTVVGLLPRLSRAEANPHVTIALPTGLGETRNTLIVRAADALVAVGGEFGTLSEIAFALKTGVPVVGLGTWELAKAGRPVDAFAVVDTPRAAVDAALEAAANRPSG